MSYLLQDLPLSFFCPTSCSSQESKGFFCQQATYKGSRSTGSQGSRWVRQGWSVATKGGREKEKKRKEKDQGRWSVATRRGREKEKKRKEKDQGRWSVTTRRGREKKKKRKEKNQGRRKVGSYEGKVPFALHQEFLFFGSQVVGLGSCPTGLKYRLLWDLVYEEAMCKGSSRNGLLYAAKAVP